MPEGPEIRREADRIRKAIAGIKTTRVDLTLEHLSSYGPLLTGRSVISVESRGKALLTNFEGGLTIYSHNQLYGKWYIVDAEKPPKTRRQLRLAIETKDKWALLYSASNIEVIDTHEIEYHPFIKRLGLDGLDPSITPSMIEKFCAVKNGNSLHCSLTRVLWPDSATTCAAKFYLSPDCDRSIKVQVLDTVTITRQR